MARNAVHSALFLISSLVSVAALFVLSGAEFIAGVQILVYVGGVMVLFLFVIMLVNVGAEERGRDEIFNKSKQVTASLIFCFPARRRSALRGQRGIRLCRRYGNNVRRRSPHRKPRGNDRFRPERRAPAATDDTERVGSSLYRYASLPFEIASVLLLVAIIGSVMLARTLKQEASADDVDPETLQQR